MQQYLFKNLLYLQNMSHKHNVEMMAVCKNTNYVSIAYKILIH